MVRCGGFCCYCCCCCCWRLRGAYCVNPLTAAAAAASTSSSITSQPAPRSHPRSGGRWSSRLSGLLHSLHASAPAPATVGYTCGQESPHVTAHASTTTTTTLAQAPPTCGHAPLLPASHGSLSSVASTESPGLTPSHITCDHTHNHTLTDACSQCLAAAGSGRHLGPHPHPKLKTEDGKGVAQGTGAITTEKDGVKGTGNLGQQEIEKGSGESNRNQQSLGRKLRRLLLKWSDSGQQQQQEGSEEKSPSGLKDRPASEPQEPNSALQPRLASHIEKHTKIEKGQEDGSGASQSEQIRKKSWQSKHTHGDPSSPTFRTPEHQGRSHQAPLTPPLNAWGLREAVRRVRRDSEGSVVSEGGARSVRGVVTSTWSRWRRLQGSVGSLTTSLRHRYQLHRFAQQDCQSTEHTLPGDSPVSPAKATSKANAVKDQEGEPETEVTQISASVGESGQKSPRCWSPVGEVSPPSTSSDEAGDSSTGTVIFRPVKGAADHVMTPQPAPCPDIVSPQQPPLSEVASVDPSQIASVSEGEEGLEVSQTGKKMLRRTSDSPAWEGEPEAKRRSLSSPVPPPSPPPSPPSSPVPPLPTCPPPDSVTALTTAAYSPLSSPSQSPPTLPSSTTNSSPNSPLSLTRKLFCETMMGEDAFSPPSPPLPIEPTALPHNTEDTGSGESESSDNFGRECEGEGWSTSAIDGDSGDSFSVTSTEKESRQTCDDSASDGSSTPTDNISKISSDGEGVMTEQISTEEETRDHGEGILNLARTGVMQAGHDTVSDVTSVFSDSEPYVTLGNYDEPQINSVTSSEQELDAGMLLNGRDSSVSKEGAIQVSDEDNLVSEVGNDQESFVSSLTSGEYHIEDKYDGVRMGVSQEYGVMVVKVERIIADHKQIVIMEASEQGPCLRTDASKQGVGASKEEEIEKVASSLRTEVSEQLESVCLEVTEQAELRKEPCEQDSISTEGNEQEEHASLKINEQKSDLRTKKSESEAVVSSEIKDEEADFICSDQQERSVNRESGSQGKRSQSLVNEQEVCEDITLSGIEPDITLVTSSAETDISPVKPGEYNYVKANDKPLVTNSLEAEVPSIVLTEEPDAPSVSDSCGYDETSVNTKDYMSDEVKAESEIMLDDVCIPYEFSTNEQGGGVSVSSSDYHRELLSRVETEKLGESVPSIEREEPGEIILSVETEESREPLIGTEKPKVVITTKEDQPREEQVFSDNLPDQGVQVNHGEGMDVTPYVNDRPERKHVSLKYIPKLRSGFSEKINDHYEHFDSPETCNDQKISGLSEQNTSAAPVFHTGEQLMVLAKLGGKPEVSSEEIKVKTSVSSEVVSTSSEEKIKTVTKLDDKPKVMPVVVGEEVTGKASETSDTQQPDLSPECTDDKQEPSQTCKTPESEQSANSGSDRSVGAVCDGGERDSLIVDHSDSASDRGDVDNEEMEDVSKDQMSSDEGETKKRSSDTEGEEAQKRPFISVEAQRAYNIKSLEDTTKGGLYAEGAEHKDKITGMTRASPRILITEVGAEGGAAMGPGNTPTITLESTSATSDLGAGSLEGAVFPIQDTTITSNYTTTSTTLASHLATHPRAPTPKSPITVDEWVAALPPNPTSVEDETEAWDGSGEGGGPSGIETASEDITEDSLNLGAEAGFMYGSGSVVTSSPATPISETAAAVATAAATTPTTATPSITQSTDSETGVRGRPIPLHTLTLHHTKPHHSASTTSTTTTTSSVSTRPLTLADVANIQRQQLEQQQPDSAGVECRRSQFASLRDKQSSFQSELSGLSFNSRSSIDSLLDSRQADPVEVLLNLGFGGQSQDGVARIPERFLKPSQVPGNSIDDFLKSEEEINEMMETAEMMPGIDPQALRKSSVATVSPLITQLLENIRENRERPPPRIEDIPAPPPTQEVTGLKRFAQLAKQTVVTNTVMSTLQAAARPSRLSSVLNPENRRLLDLQGQKSPEVPRKRLIIGQKSFDIGRDGQLLSDQELSEEVQEAQEDKEETEDREEGELYHDLLQHKDSVWSMASSNTSVDSSEEDLRESLRLLQQDLSRRSRHHLYDTHYMADPFDATTLTSSASDSAERLRKERLLKRLGSHKRKSTSSAHEVEERIPEEDTEDECSSTMQEAISEADPSQHSCSDGGSTHNTTAHHRLPPCPVTSQQSQLHSFHSPIPLQQPCTHACTSPAFHHSCHNLIAPQQTFSHPSHSLPMPRPCHCTAFVSDPHHQIPQIFSSSARFLHPSQNLVPPGQNCIGARHQVSPIHCISHISHPSGMGVNTNELRHQPSSAQRGGNGLRRQECVDETNSAFLDPNGHQPATVVMDQQGNMSGGEGGGEDGTKLLVRGGGVVGPLCRSSSAQSDSSGFMEGEGAEGESRPGPTTNITVITTATSSTTTSLHSQGSAWWWWSRDSGCSVDTVRHVPLTRSLALPLDQHPPDHQPTGEDLASPVSCPIIRSSSTPAAPVSNKCFQIHHSHSLDCCHSSQQHSNTLQRSTPFSSSLSLDNSQSSAFHPYKLNMSAEQLTLKHGPLCLHCFPSPIKQSHTLRDSPTTQSSVHRRLARRVRQRRHSLPEPLPASLDAAVTPSHYHQSQAPWWWTAQSGELVFPPPSSSDLASNPAASSPLLHPTQARRLQRSSTAPTHSSSLLHNPPPYEMLNTLDSYRQKLMEQEQISEQLYNLACETAGCQSSVQQLHVQLRSIREIRAAIRAEVTLMEQLMVGAQPGTLTQASLSRVLSQMMFLLQQQSELCRDLETLTFASQHEPLHTSASASSSLMSLDHQPASQDQQKNNLTCPDTEMDTSLETPSLSRSDPVSCPPVTTKMSGERKVPLTIDLSNTSVDENSPLDKDHNTLNSPGASNYYSLDNSPECRRLVSHGLLGALGASQYPASDMKTPQSKKREEGEKKNSASSMPQELTLNGNSHSSQMDLAGQVAQLVRAEVVGQTEALQQQLSRQTKDVADIKDLVKLLLTRLK